MVKLRYFVVALLLPLIGCKIDPGGFFIGTSSPTTRFHESQSMTHDRPLPAVKVGKSYSFLLGSDLHYKGDGNRLHQFMLAAKAKPYAFVAHLGDLQKVKTDPLAVLRDSIVANEIAPFYHVVGNHDLYDDQCDDYFEIYGPTVYYYVLEGEGYKDLFVVLDTANGNMQSDQIGWLEQLLRDQRAAHRHCFIFTHNNFFRLDASFALTALLPKEELYRLTALFAQYHVDHVVMGHVHKYSQIALRSVTYTTLTTMQTDNPDGALYAFHCDADGAIRFEQFPLDP